MICFDGARTTGELTVQTAFIEKDEKGWEKNGKGRDEEKWCEWGYNVPCRFEILERPLVQSNAWINAVNCGYVVF